MRDLIVIAIVAVGCLAALRRPWIGVMLWTWLSIMNPHRYTWGVAYEAPLAASTAAATLIGLLLTRDRESPFKSPAVVLFTVIFMPESDGFGGIDASRRDFASTRIIAISGGAPAVKTNYLDAAGLIGVDAALQKPFEMDELLRVLKSMQ